jgi:hypothetical protein
MVCCGLVGVLLLASAGCATHSLEAGTAVGQVQAGDFPAALRWAEKLQKSHRSENLGQLEAGRIRMLSGDFAGSRSDFEEAIDRILDDTETGPVFRAGSAANTLTAATVADDTFRRYEPPPYEVIQLLHYQTLNYLLSGNPDGARVEMRRTVFAQEALAERYGAQVQKDQERVRKEQPDAWQSVLARQTRALAQIEPTRSAYENGLAWYLCGLLFEMDGDTSNAALSYRKAQELTPDNRTIRTECLRTLQTQDPLAADVAPPARGETGLVVIYEEAMVSRRLAEKILVPIPDFDESLTLVSIDLPFYPEARVRSAARPLDIHADGRLLGAADPAVFVESMAVRDLHDKMAGILLRNLSRAAIKVASQQVANHQDDDRWRFGMMILNAISSSASTADTRAWYTLPKVTYLYRGDLEPGTHVISVRGHSRRITVAPGETRLLWIADTGGWRMAADASLTGKGLPPAVEPFNNTTHQQPKE